MVAFPALEKPYGMKRILSVSVTQKRKGNLKLNRVPDIGRVKHVFEFPWDTLSRAERTTEDSFFQSVRGRLSPVEVTDPWDAVAYDCRLDEDELAMREDEPTRWGSSLRLVEVMNFKALKAAVTAFPVLSVTGAVMQLPYEMRRLYHTVIGAHRDFTERRYEDFAAAAGVQRWLVGGDQLSDADAVLLLNAWEGNLGPLEAFVNFVEPETGVNYPSVHFLETEVTHILHEQNRNEIRLTLEQLL